MSRFIYSSLSFYGSELSGAWFTAVLTDLGIEEHAIRQTLYRLEREGVLTSRKDGRVKFYAPSATSRAIIEAGRDKMLARPEGKWDGKWTIVRFILDNEKRELRDRLRNVLRVEGFAPLGPGLYIHPRDRSARIRDAVKGHVHVFRGARVDDGLDDRRFVRELWPLDDIAQRYRRFLAAFAPVARRRTRLAPRDAAAHRFALVFQFLEVAWDDPELPADLLPAHWPGHRARTLVRKLYRSLAPAARAFGVRPR